MSVFPDEYGTRPEHREVEPAAGRVEGDLRRVDDVTRKSRQRRGGSRKDSR